MRTDLDYFIHENDIKNKEIFKNTKIIQLSSTTISIFHTNRYQISKYVMTGKISEIQR